MQPSFQSRSQLMQIAPPRSLGRIQDGGKSSPLAFIKLCTVLSDHVRCGGCFDRGMANRAVFKVFIAFFTTICAPYPLVFSYGLCSPLLAYCSLMRGRVFCVYMESWGAWVSCCSSTGLSLCLGCFPVYCCWQWKSCCNETTYQFSQN